jgi:hypothetical protein
MARARKTDEPEPLYEATQSFASQWIDENALDDFATGVVKKGTLVRASHPILKAHPELFIPARADLRASAWASGSRCQGMRHEVLRRLQPGKL